MGFSIASTFIAVPAKYSNRNRTQTVTLVETYRLKLAIYCLQKNQKTLSLVKNKRAVVYFGIAASPPSFTCFHFSLKK